ncbi:hypothetical protein [Streptomyces pharetrae]
MPVLDGLDELPGELRAPALAAVNHAVAVHGRSSSPPARPRSGA